MIGEVWRTVPSLPHIMVSSEGRVMVAPFLAEMPHGGKRHYGGQPSFGVWSKEDARFLLIHNGHSYKVARLVCEAFHGPAPQDEPCCLHCDENSANNRADNVRWGTQKENLNAPAFLAYCHERTGSDSPFLRGRRAASK